MGDMALMPKLCEKYPILGDFLMIFGTFGAQIVPHILLQTPYEWMFYLSDTQMATYLDSKHGNEFPVQENGIEHMSHI